MKKRITLSTISAESGVSIGTVSAILKKSKSNNSRYTEKTRDRVLEVAAKLGYRPNRTAQSLQNKRHDAIGILVREFWYVYETRFKGILHEAEKRGQLVIMEAVPGDQSKLPNIIKEDCVDGIILFEEVGKHINKAINRLSIPSVGVNSGQGTTASINFNSATAFARALTHFEEIGRSNLLVITGGKGAYQLDFTNFKKSAFLSGNRYLKTLKFDSYFEHPSFHSEIVSGIKEILKTNRKIDSVFMANDYFAPSLYQACNDLNLKIPEDLAVIGCNDTTAARHVIPPLTSVCIDRELVGRTSVKMLNELIDGKSSKTKIKKTKTFEYNLIKRESSRCRSKMVSSSGNQLSVNDIELSATS